MEDSLTIDDLAPKAPDEFAASLAAWLGPVDIEAYPRLASNAAKGAPVSFRLDETFERRLDYIVQLSRERGLPWKTRTDFIRDAVIWFAEELVRKLALQRDVPELSELGTIQRLRDRTEYLNGIRKLAISDSRQLYTLLNQLLLAGKREDAKRELGTFLAAMRAMGSDLARRVYEEGFRSNEQLADLISTLEDTK